ncbi:MAG: hypothetical protein LBR73_07685 [Oscillospiraceae bacterium]|nr:hypothetical protein [Oscillospiraceae bacterium]
MIILELIDALFGALSTGAGALVSYWTAFVDIFEAVLGASGFIQGIIAFVELITGLFEPVAA